MEEFTSCDENDEIFLVSEGMQHYGGSFVENLGIALAHADIHNARKIKVTWPEYWSEYLDFGKKLHKVCEK